MTDTFVAKLKSEVRAATLEQYVTEIQFAILEGMSHKGDSLSKYSKILENVNTVTQKMSDEVMEYERSKV